MKNLLNRHTLYKKVCILFAIIFCICGLTDVDTAFADSPKGLILLDGGVTYDQYDVTGDGKADTFRFHHQSNGYSDVYLNGKYIQNIFMAKGGWFYLWKYSKNRIYLILNFGQFGGRGISIYTYNQQNKQFICVADGTTFLETTFAYKVIDQVRKNTLYISSSYYPSSGRGATSFANASDLPSFITKYRFYGNKLKPVSRVATISDKKIYTAVNSFDTKTTKKLTGKGPSVKAGTKVQLLGIYFSPQGGTVLKAKIGKKIGWFENSNMCQLGS